MEALTIPHILTVVIVYASSASLTQERLAAFGKLSPKEKQLVNTITNAIIPTIVMIYSLFVEVGNRIIIEDALTNIVFLLSPLIAWIASQAIHAGDRIAKKAG